MRLAHARRELERARADATVTDVALASGFTQFGRFASHYRAVFGEAPSMTLRRSRHTRAGEYAMRSTTRLSASPGRRCRMCSRLLRVNAARRSRRSRHLPEKRRAMVCRSRSPPGAGRQRAAHGFGAAPRMIAIMRCGWLQQACTLAPNDALALTLASGALTLAHRLDEADRLLERLLALDPWLPYAWVRRGWASVYMGDPDAAYSRTENCAASVPDRAYAAHRIHRRWAARILRPDATSERRAGCRAGRMASPGPSGQTALPLRRPPTREPMPKLAALHPGSCARTLT